MKKEEEKYRDLKVLWKQIPIYWKVTLTILLGTTVGLFVGAFFVPPTGVIDSSILFAGGLLMLPVCVYVICCAKIIGIEMNLLQIDVKQGKITIGGDEDNN